MWPAEYRSAILGKRERTMTPRPLLVNKRNPIPPELTRFFHDEDMFKPIETAQKFLHISLYSGYIIVAAKHFVGRRVV